MSTAISPGPGASNARSTGCSGATDAVAGVTSCCARTVDDTGAGPSPSDLDVEVFETAQVDATVPDGVTDDPRVREPADEGADRDLGLQSRQ